MKNEKSIDLSEAVELCEDAVKLAKEKKVSIAVTVIDARGMILATMAMDDTLLISPSLSRKKAITALSLKVSTMELQKQGVNTADLGGGYCSFGGGIPIKDSDGVIIGAMGVSGLDIGEKDHQLAAQALSKRDKKFDKQISPLTKKEMRYIENDLYKYCRERLDFSKEDARHYAEIMVCALANSIREDIEEDKY